MSAQNKLLYSFFALLLCFAATNVNASDIVPGTNNRIGDEIPFVEGQPAPAAPQGFAWCLEKRPAVMETVRKRVLVRGEQSYYENVPPKYATRMEKVMVEPEQKRAILVCPATYKTVNEQKLIQPKSIDFRTIPAKFRWVEETVEVVPARREKVLIPAKYETYSERIMIRPARTVREEVPGCDDDGGKIECYSSRVIPAEYQTITKKRLVSPAREESRVIPAQKRVMKVKQLVSPARVEKVEIPAQYETVQKKVLDKPAQYRYETIPPKYRNVERKVIIQPEGKRKVTVPAKYETISSMRVVKPESLVWVLNCANKVSACPINNNDNRVEIDAGRAGDSVEVDTIIRKYGRVPGTRSNR